MMTTPLDVPTGLATAVADLEARGARRGYVTRAEVFAALRARHAKRQGK